MIQLHLTSPLGTAISVTLENTADILPTMRQYGRLGYTSGEVPSGGFSLPLANADDFDFALIGAHLYVNQEGEACVMYRGQSDRGRELEAVEAKKMNLPKIVKYSRGARPTDLPHVKEGGDGGIQYVTLLTFLGGGRNGWLTRRELCRKTPPTEQPHSYTASGPHSVAGRNPIGPNKTTLTEGRIGLSRCTSGLQLAWSS